MKEKLQIIYNEFVKYEPKISEAGNNYHSWNLAHNHLRNLLHKVGGRDKIEQYKDEMYKRTGHHSYKI
jgi:hypothetical protein